ncbi:MAG: PD-(D/E)XK nuclease domain-containing protein, partial [Bacteroidota bacterium]
SKFSKMSLFSGLNNLEDITLNARYGDICGYTHEDLENVFTGYFENVNLENVRLWYNGYNYLGNKVYNPYDILLFLKNQHEFGNYWWRTGNPSFLIELVQTKDYAIPQVENYEATEEILDSFDVDTIALEVLLWQTGYLTITRKFRERNRIKYQLGIPNREVQLSLNDFFIDALTTQKIEKLRYQDQLHEVLIAADLERLKQTISKLFASIPYHNFTNNNLAQYEGYYASVVYAYLASLGYSIIPEDITSKGRIDLTLQLPNKTYIFEFKVVDAPTQSALQQIKERRYYEKYDNDLPTYLVGIEFGKNERNIIGWAVEKR